MRQRGARPSVRRTVKAPRATYRLQLNGSFDLRAAARIVPYLAALGVSHVYCASYLRARAGSTHGYDIVDHNVVNPELGGDAALDAFLAALRRHHMGHVLDFVPNHMGVARADNPWWLDVLAWGPAAPAADWFDICRLDLPEVTTMKSASEVLPVRSMVTVSSAFMSSMRARTRRRASSASGRTLETWFGGATCASPGECGCGQGSFLSVPLRRCITASRRSRHTPKIGMAG